MVLKFFNSLWWVQYISGTIMFDETLFQLSRAGVPFVDILKKQGILPGIKVDTGLQPIDGTDGETSTQGLAGLAERCKRSVPFLAPLTQNFWRTITQAVSDLPTHKEKLYCFSSSSKLSSIFSTGGVCLISPGFLVGDEIEVLVYNNLLESYPRPMEIST
jgi:fructose-bisphosphate aldolase class 1